MRSARWIGLAAVGAAAAVGLSGCTKPPPAVTAWSGTTSANQQALCWSANGGLAPGSCAADIVQGARTDGIPVIGGTAGNVLGVSVDTSVAEIGWVPVIQGKPIADVQHDTYYRLTIPDSLNQDLNLQVIAGSATAPQGVWLFRIQP